MTWKEQPAVDSLIARIKARVADPLRAADAAGWVHPLPTVNPPATAAEIDAAERALGFAIPVLLRRLYLEVGNGGFGPAYGLEGVPTIPPSPERSDLVAMYSTLVSAPPPEENPSWCWPAGLVPLIGHGCNIWECVDFLHEPHPTVIQNPDEIDWDRPLIGQLQPGAPSLAARLETWLSESGS